jgi:lipoate-protein ligase A
MGEQMRFRLIPFSQNHPFANMAVDEAVYTAFKEGVGEPTLRLYGWVPRAVSLGLSQEAKSVINFTECRKRGMIIVRRPSGGEALIHGSDVSYSVTCNTGDLNLPDSIKMSYRVICRFLIRAYAKLGIDASFADDRPGYRRSQFCLAAKGAYDLCVNGRKLGGNAQKRARGVLFQHGSVPLNLNYYSLNGIFNEELRAPENDMISLSEALQSDISFKKFSEMMAEAFSEVFEVDFDRHGLTNYEVKLAEKFFRDKYSKYEYNVNRAKETVLA